MQLMSFASDYEEGAHPAILERLSQTNLLKTPGYGTDEFCAAARKKIRDACSCPEAAVYFLMGGTQTNATVIGALLRPYQGVVAAETGHICLHEGGAIEHGGHKVLPLPQKEGKLSAAEVERFCAAWKKDENRDHMVAPGMVYLSQPTEYGTLYSLEELIDLRAVCDRYALPLYVDGARLAYALACKSNDVTLQDLALHRRHQMRGAVRGGAGGSEPPAFAGLLHRLQAERRGAGQGAAAGAAIRHVVYQQPLPEHRRRGYPGGGADAQRLSPGGLPSGPGEPHQPDFRFAGKQRDGASGGAGGVQLLGERGPEPHRGALCLQLGHHSGPDGPAGTAPSPLGAALKNSFGERKETEQQEAARKQLRKRQESNYEYRKQQEGNLK